jgi:hypothetical protein
MGELSLYPGEQPAGAAGPLQHQLQHVQDSRGGAAQHAQRRLQSFSRKLSLNLKGTVQLELICEILIWLLQADDCPEVAKRSKDKPVISISQTVTALSAGQNNVPCRSE